MTKLFLLSALCLIILSGTVYSQKGSFGLTVGTTMSTYKVKAESLSLTSKAKVGLTVGIFTEIPIGSSASFMPALNFVQKGGTLKEGDMKDRLTTNYLEVPLNFVYKAKLTKGKLFAGAGPSVSIGISGKDKWDAGGSSGDDEVKFGKDEDFRRMEAGLNIVTGYVAQSGMILALNYNAGLTNSVDPGEGEGKFHNRYFGLRLGFRL